GVGNNGHYVEFYNQADTTVYLDGIIFFKTGLGLHMNAFGVVETCDYNAEWRMDPAGLWASTLSRFPGSGRDFPIHPGEYRVLATNATDHRSVGGGMQDLRQAHFEFRGNDADPDNPASADMLYLKPSGGPFGDVLVPNVVMGI